ncbi:MAG TPA: discoidin domain-containing protein [Polyangia bacterium]|nr:discoidin domain-containing protein [Polyangia bacterium]
MRINRLVPWLLCMPALAVGCTAAESFRGNRDGGAGGSGGSVVIGTGGFGEGTGGAIIDGTGGSGGVVEGTGGSGTGGAGGSAAVDAELEAAPDLAEDLPVEQRDAPPETGQVLTFEDSCLNVRWTATASLANNLAGNAIDGDTATVWQTSAPQVGREFFQINLGASARLTQVVLDNTAGHQTDYPRAYQVLASTDGATFPTTVTMASPAPPGATTQITFAPVSARALRIVQTGSDPTYWWTIHELRLGCQPIGVPAGAIDPLDTSHWTVSASSSIGGSGPGNAIDGDPTTRWTSGHHQLGDEWFLVDMSASTTVSEVWLATHMSPGDFPAQYAVELSTNGETYTGVATGGGQEITKIKFAATPARFVRIKQTGQTPVAWWSIDQMTIRP